VQCCWECHGSTASCTEVMNAVAVLLVMVMVMVIVMMIPVMCHTFARFSKMIVVGKQGGCLPHAIR
jgi:hypothetical protein